VTFICLLLLGLARLFLGFFPFWFHAMNHKLMSYISMIMTIAFPIIVTVQRFYKCGIPCDPSANVAFAGLYGHVLNVTVCDRAYFLPYTFAALVLIYFVTVLLACRQHNATVRPIQPLDVLREQSFSHAIHGNAYKSFRYEIHRQGKNGRFKRGPVRTISGYLEGQAVQVWVGIVTRALTYRLFYK
jgi:hypothetical protein